MLTRSDQEMRDAFTTAVHVCVTGHDHCSYGGMSPTGGYWLIAEGCALDHGDACAFCDDPTEVRFSDWVGEPFGLIYAVPACEPCAERWAGLDPRWQRGVPDADDV